MKKLRPLVGALLTILALAAAAPAAEVETLLPGGSSDFAPPRDQPDFVTSNQPAGPRFQASQPRRDNNNSRTSVEPMLQTRHFGSQVELTCTVGDRPDALVVVNNSDEPLPAGTRIKWQLKSDGLQGYFRILGPLEGGDTLVADNVLKGGASTGGTCIARVI